jgi:signal transduction histidine kinase
MGREPGMTALFKAWKKGEAFHVYKYAGKILKNFYATLTAQNPDFPMPGKLPARQLANNFIIPEGSLFVFTVDEMPTEDKMVMRRFAQVFSLTYRRYQDLMRVEAQARESQIEAALEKARGSAMAMHNSDELRDVVAVIYKELEKLGIDVHLCVIINYSWKTTDMDWWMTGFGGVALPRSYHVPLDESIVNHPMVQRYFEAQKKKIPFSVFNLAGKSKRVWDRYLFTRTELKQLPEAVKQGMMSYERVLLSDAVLNFGTLEVAGIDPLSEEKAYILQRFAKVIDLTYTRVKELQRVESRARESQIEASLERVRSRSMAMQHSSELNNILATMFAELTSLGLELARCIIWTFNPEDRTCLWWAANPEAESGAESFLIPYTDHPTCNEYWKSWEERRSRFLYELSGETKKAWDDYLFTRTEMSRLPEQVQAAMMAPEKVYLYNSFRDFGVLFAVGLQPLGDENFDIIERFGKVFEQSYTRFNDIRQAEEREKEAIRQASLDRIRAEIASMRTAKDLERITPLIWKELTALGVPFIRCGVFIMDEGHQIIHNFLSTPDGKAIAAFHLPFDTPGAIARILKHWHKRERYLDHWDDVAMKDFANMLVSQGIFKSPDQYLNTLPRGGFFLHFLPFLQGMLYVGNLEQLDEESIDLLQAVADAFSTAYARYEDFTKLEAAKLQVDQTLLELRQAQQQLVQSEKMASLGELTAGIAHEIQNPLNFVNNFSEVSNELIAEMLDEVRKGNVDDAEAIAQSLRQNLEKINHHGRRADGIVKGMLLHSRTSSGQREVTDINMLCDEYLRLSYHGYRAKDKSFSANYETDFDEALEKINVVPQDIGRVVLNLINNAFYAVGEKRKSENGRAGYEPLVSVSTRNNNGFVEVNIKDNGDGVPESIREKIFQPFFTTKPTGSGTGLGLSLSYDIVKAHGGELGIESKPGTGTVFIIRIPSM